MHLYFEQSMAFVQNWGAPQILLVLFLILLLFGAKKLPELARGMGKALREFKSATRDVEDDIRSALEDDDVKPAARKKPPVAEEPPKEKQASGSDTASSA